MQTHLILLSYCAIIGEVKGEKANNTIKEMGNMDNKKVKTIIIGCIAGIAVLTAAMNSFTIVQSGHTGVVVVMGKVTGETFSDGMHLKAPFISTVVKMDNQVQKTEVETSAVSKDLQTVSANVAINYHLSAEQSADVYKNIGMGYIDKILAPAIHEATKAVMAKYSAEQLITQRGSVSIEIQTLLTEKTSGYGIIVDELNLTNFDFSAEFNAAIEAKQVAEQNKIKANTEKEQRVIEAEAAASEKTIAANAEAEARKAIAEAEAEAMRVKAEAEAEAMRVKAEAEAEANKKISESLNSDVLNNKAIEKWNGKYPDVVAGDGSNMLISIDSGSESENTGGTIVNSSENE